MKRTVAVNDRRSHTAPGEGKGIATLFSIFAATLMAAVTLSAASLGLEEAVALPQAECDAPIAYVPPVLPGDESFADGSLYCPSGAGFTGYVKLINRAGNTLTQTNYGAGSGNWYLYTSTVSCLGAYVRTHIWINTAGTGKSDTSGENSDCAY